MKHQTLELRNIDEYKALEKATEREGLCAGDGDYTPWTKRYVCAFCHVDVTADNIGLTVNFHICDKCIHTDKVLEFLESQGNTGHTIGYEGSQQTSKGTISLQELVKQIAIKVGLYHILYSEKLPLLLLSRIDHYISKGAKPQHTTSSEYQGWLDEPANVEATW